MLLLQTVGKHEVLCWIHSVSRGKPAWGPQQLHLTCYTLSISKSHTPALVSYQRLFRETKCATWELTPEIIADATLHLVSVLGVSALQLWIHHWLTMLCFINETEKSLWKCCNLSVSLFVIRDLNGLFHRKGSFALQNSVHFKFSVL